MECDCGLSATDIETRLSVQLNQTVSHLFHNTLVKEVFTTFN